MSMSRKDDTKRFQMRCKPLDSLSLNKRQSIAFVSDFSDSCIHVPGLVIAPSEEPIDPDAETDLVDWIDESNE